MKQGRILILGQTKENSYEIRNLLDNRRFELEIALNPEVGKLILGARRMNLLIIHTEMISEQLAEFFDFLDERGISIPMMLLGEEASQLRDQLPDAEQVACFDKPYAVDEMVSYIGSL